MKHMNREEFEAYIKGLSVDEMVQMMPQSIKMKWTITPSMRRHNYHQWIPEELDDYEYEYYLSIAYDEMREYKSLYAWKMTYEFEWSKDECCKEMLLWLYDNNLLPDQKDDE